MWFAVHLGYISVFQLNKKEKKWFTVHRLYLDWSVRLGRAVPVRVRGHSHLQTLPVKSYLVSSIHSTLSLLLTHSLPLFIYFLILVLCRNLAIVRFGVNAVLWS